MGGPNPVSGKLKGKNRGEMEWPLVTTLRWTSEKQAYRTCVNQRNAGTVQYVNLLVSFRFGRTHIFAHWIPNQDGAQGIFDSIYAEPRGRWSPPAQPLYIHIYIYTCVCIYILSTYLSFALLRCTASFTTETRLAWLTSARVTQRINS